MISVGSISIGDAGDFSSFATKPSLLSEAKRNTGQRFTRLVAVPVIVGNLAFKQPTRAVTAKGLGIGGENPDRFSGLCRLLAGRVIRVPACGLLLWYQSGAGTCQPIRHPVAAEFDLVEPERSQQ